MNKKEFERLIKNRPDLQELNVGVLKEVEKVQSDIRKKIEKQIDSPGEATFLLLWRHLTDEPVEQEHLFHPTRKWRADFCHLPTKTLIEIEGGTRGRGRHNRHEGYRKDTEKYNAAQELGYKVYRFVTEDVTLDNVRSLLDNIGLVTKVTM